MRVIRHGLSETDSESQSVWDNPFCIISGMSEDDLDTPDGRLRAARKAAGYATPGDAANAMGVPHPTYYAHENGTKGLSRSGDRYARFFHVSLDWLLANRGDMTAGITRVPWMGLVGAGSTVEPIGDTAAASLGEIEIPSGEHLGALVVNGDSQYPRYMHGEAILYDRRPEPPARLVNRYAIVDCADGRRVIKKLIKGRRPSSWTLWSHNAPEEPDADILAVYRVVGTLDR